MKNSSKFFSNKDCEYYPCHKNIKELNCLFCYCPLHNLKDCGGKFEILSNGVKDCSGCIFPHLPHNYDIVISKIKI